MQKIPLILVLFRQVGLWPQTAIFSAKRSPKMRESQQLFFRLRLVSRIFEEFQHPAIQIKIVLHLGGFFHQIKVRQPIGSKDSITSRLPKNEEIGGILYLAVKNFELFFSKIKIKIKKFKTYCIAVDVHSETYPMVPLSCRPNLARRYLQIDR